MSCTVEMWKATASPGDSEWQLTVVGEGTCPSDCCTLHLEPGGHGTYYDPKVIVLHLVESEFKTSNRDVTQVQVRYETTISKHVSFVHVETANGRKAVEVTSLLHPR